MDKEKNKTAKGPPREGTPSNPIRGLLTRTDLETLISSQTGPITNSADAHKWFENKGWLPAGEQLDRTKLVCALFTISLLPKVPPEVTNAIRAAAFLLEDDISDKLNNNLAMAINEKIKSGLSTFAEEISTFQTFLQASSIQQASTLLELQRITAQSTVSTNKLNDLITKIPDPKLLPQLPQPTHNNKWPTLQHPSLPPRPSLPNPTFNPSSPDKIIRLKQRILQSARIITIQLDQNIPNELTPQPPLDLSNIRTSFNRRLEDLDNDSDPTLDFDTPSSTVRPKTVIRGIQKRDNGTLLLELDSPESATRFINYTTEHFFLLETQFGRPASIKLKSYPLIFKFVPCTNEFNPNNPDCLRELESNYNLKSNSIISANWLKRPDRRAPNQQVASLKVSCSDPHTANRLLTEKVFIDGHVITVIKDIREPIRCNNCQEFGHIRHNCKNKEICAHCSSKDHKTTDCPPNQPPRCRACGPNSHPSYSRKCPEFTNRCSSLDDQYPENLMPYFPTGDDWTWVMSPPKSKPTAQASNTSNLHPNDRPPPPNNRQVNLDEFIVPRHTTTQHIQANEPNTVQYPNDK
jgi:hypothetical protein